MGVYNAKTIRTAKFTIQANVRAVVAAADMHHLSNYFQPTKKHEFKEYSMLLQRSGEIQVHARRAIVYIAESRQAYCCMSLYRQPQVKNGSNSTLLSDWLP